MTFVCGSVHFSLPGGLYEFYLVRVYFASPREPHAWGGWVGGQGSGGHQASMGWLGRPGPRLSETNVERAAYPEHRPHRQSVHTRRD